MAGFSVSGRVVDPSGEGVEGAVVKMDGTQRAVTDAKGNYHLGSMTSGVNEILFVCLFVCLGGRLVWVCFLENFVVC